VCTLPHWKVECFLHRCICEPVFVCCVYFCRCFLPVLSDSQKHENEFLSEIDDSVRYMLFCNLHQMSWRLIGYVAENNRKKGNITSNGNGTVQWMIYHLWLVLSFLVSCKSCRHAYHIQYEPTRCDILEYVRYLAYGKKDICVHIAGLLQIRCIWSNYWLHSDQ